MDEVVKENIKYRDNKESIMNHPLLKKFKIKSLKEVPYIRGRIAKEKDMQDGKAIFYLPEKGITKPAKLNIPCFAYQKKKPIIIFQAEETTQGIVLGVRYVDNSTGVCMLSDVKFIFNLLPSATKFTLGEILTATKISPRIYSLELMNQ